MGEGCCLEGGCLVVGCLVGGNLDGAFVDGGLDGGLDDELDGGYPKAVRLTLSSQPPEINWTPPMMK